LARRIDKVVVNASPLILLSKVGLADLLSTLFDEVLVPHAVWWEIVAGGETDRTTDVLASLSKLTRVTLEAVPDEILVWNLGDGEAEVLTCALTQERCALVDDKAARTCARALGIRILGTGGVLVLAKRQGLIRSVSDELCRLIEAGLWISNEMISLIQEQADEIR
jgi:predicted nucleic acid-binding protein